MKACKRWLVATRKLKGSVTQATAYLKERWSILSQNIGSRDRVSNPSCHTEWFCYFEQIIAFLYLSFPIRKTRKIIPFADFMASSIMVKFLEGRPSARVLVPLEYHLSPWTAFGAVQRACVRALTRVEFFSSCLGSILRPRGEALWKCQAV